mgnify:CR=1 FL=1
MVISKTYEFHCHFGLSALSGLTGLTKLNEYGNKLFIEMLVSAKGTRPGVVQGQLVQSNTQFIALFNNL